MHSIRRLELTLFVKTERTGSARIKIKSRPKPFSENETRINLTEVIVTLTFFHRQKKLQKSLVLFQIVRKLAGSTATKKVVDWKSKRKRLSCSCNEPAAFDSSLYGMWTDESELDFWLKLNLIPQSPELSPAGAISMWNRYGRREILRKIVYGYFYFLTFSSINGT